MSSLIKDSCISITDLKKNAHTIIKDLHNGSKVIFINNKPIAILSSVDNFDLHIDEPFSFSFNPPLDPKVILDHFAQTNG